ncbi:MAG: hypothetical protein ACRBC3_02710 [Burkholderiaceae bacterium]
MIADADADGANLALAGMDVFFDQDTARLEPTRNPLSMSSAQKP